MIAMWGLYCYQMSNQPSLIPNYLDLLLHLKIAGKATPVLICNKSLRKGIFFTDDDNQIMTQLSHVLLSKDRIENQP